MSDNVIREQILGDVDTTDLIHMAVLDIAGEHVPFDYDHIADIRDEITKYLRAYGVKNFKKVDWKQ